MPHLPEKWSESELNAGRQDRLFDSWPNECRGARIGVVEPRCVTVAGKRGDRRAGKLRVGCGARRISVPDRDSERSLTCTGEVVDTRRPSTTRTFGTIHGRVFLTNGFVGREPNLLGEFRRRIADKSPVAIGRSFECRRVVDEVVIPRRREDEPDTAPVFTTLVAHWIGDVAEEPPEPECAL